MIPLAGGLLSSATILLATPDSGGAAAMTTEWSTSFISPGVDPNNPQKFRGFLELWVENTSDANLDFAVIQTIQDTLSTTILAATKVYLLRKLIPTDRFVFTAPPGGLIVGPVYVRGTTADPTTSATAGVLYGGWVR